MAFNYYITDGTNEYPVYDIQFGPDEYASKLAGTGYKLVPGRRPDYPTSSGNGGNGATPPSDVYKDKSLTVFNPETGKEEKMSSVGQIDQALRATDEQGNSTGYVKMPDGTIAQMGQSTDSAGNVVQGRVVEVPSGGLLINGLPINVMLDPSSITEEQKSLLKELGIPEGGWGTFAEWESGGRTTQTPWIKTENLDLGDPGETPDPLNPPINPPINPPPGDPPPSDPPPSDPTKPDPDASFKKFLETLGLFETPEMDLPELPDVERVPTRFGQVKDPQTGEMVDYDKFYAGYLDQQAKNIGERYYGGWDTPLSTAAQMDLEGVPQPTAQTPEQFEALQFLLSGQGFDPATLARMRAGATDAAALAGRSQAGTARLMGQQAGLEGSPAALALEASARRRQGDATTRALNEIEIANAMQGMQNRLAGAGMELGRQTSGAAMANQVALQNASNILSGMQQNVGNLQQSNLFNTGNLFNQRMTQAAQQAGLYGSGSQAFNEASLGQATRAPFFNAAQQYERDRDRAQLQSQRDQFNIGNLMTRYGWDMGNLVNLANQTAAQNYYNLANQETGGLQGKSPWEGLNLWGQQGGG